MGFWDFLDTVGNKLDSIGSTIKPFAPVLDFGLGMYGMNQAEKMADKQRNAQVQMEKEKYDNALAMMNAANALGAGGGGGGANRAIQAANERARLKALNKSIAYQKKMGKKSRKNLEPYDRVGKELLPAVANTYRGSLEGMNALNAFLNRPEEMAKLSAAPASGMAAVDLPEYMRGARKKDGK